MPQPPAPGARVMGIEELEKFKLSVRSYTKAVGAKITTIEHGEVFKLLEHHNLTPTKIIETFTRPAKQKN